MAVMARKSRRGKIGVLDPAAVLSKDGGYSLLVLPKSQAGACTISTATESEWAALLWLDGADAKAWWAGGSLQWSLR